MNLSRCGAGECLEAVSNELTFFTLPNCFELFGFDLIVDEDWQIWLLEVSSADVVQNRKSCQKQALQHDTCILVAMKVLASHNVITEY